jgi:hypothetical protein
VLKVLMKKGLLKDTGRSLLQSKWSRAVRTKIAVRNIPQILFAAAVGVLVVGCARTSTLPLAADTVQISSSAALACGPEGAQKVALKRAAIETINRGFDKFIIVGAGQSSSVGVVGHTPVRAQTYGSGEATTFGNTTTFTGQATTTYTGGFPIISGRHNEQLVVKMFRSDDASGANAVSARETLGVDWQEQVKSTTITCF